MNFLRQLTEQDTTIILFVLFGFCVCYVIKKKIPKEKLVSAKLIDFVLISMEALLFFSLVIYIIIRINSNLQPSVDTWVVALDTALAHFVVTFLFFYIVSQLLRIIYNKSISLVYEILSLLIVGFLPKILLSINNFISYLIKRFDRSVPNKTKMHDLDTYKFYSISFVEIIVYLIEFIMKIIIPLFLTKFLIYDRVDLQNILFGAYDKQLGLTYPSNFKLTVLFNRIKVLIETENLRTILTFFGIIISSTVIITTVVQAIFEINKASHSRDN